MAARSKKQSSLSQTIQEPENTLTEMLGMNMPGEPLSVGAGVNENLPESSSPAEQFEATDSEETMSTESDILQPLSSEETRADDPVEPVINLEPVLSIQNVVKLYEKLKKVYATYDAIEIDASHVTSVDTASLQLFAALKKDAAKQNKEVLFFQPSPRFIESARLLDLINILEIVDV